MTYLPAALLVVLALSACSVTSDQKFTPTEKVPSAGSDVRESIDTVDLSGVDNTNQDRIVYEIDEIADISEWSTFTSGDSSYSVSYPPNWKTNVELVTDEVTRVRFSSDKLNGPSLSITKIPLSSKDGMSDDQQYDDILNVRNRGNGGKMIVNGESYDVFGGGLSRFPSNLSNVNITFIRYIVKRDGEFEYVLNIKEALDHSMVLDEYEKYVAGFVTTLKTLE